MNPTIRRRLRWALWGAAILAILAIVLGGLFTVLIALAEDNPAAGSGFAYWSGLLLRSLLLWGLGALPFGAALGMFASMIWPDDNS